MTMIMIHSVKPHYSNIDSIHDLILIFIVHFLGPNQQQYYGQYPPPPQQQGFNQAPYNPAYPHQNPTENTMYNGYQDPESDKNFDFNDDSIRRGFIKKVYSILCVSLEFI